MTGSFVRRASVPSLALVAALLVVGSWWYLQRSACVGDLKQGVGDVQTAFELEGRALAVHLLGIMTIAVAASTHLRPLWFRGIAVLAALPCAYVSFLALGLFGGHAAWVCAR
jgi:hypothetical protein